MSRRCLFCVVALCWACEDPVSTRNNQDMTPPTMDMIGASDLTVDQRTSEMTALKDASSDQPGDTPLDMDSGSDLSTTKDQGSTQDMARDLSLDLSPTDMIGDLSADMGLNKDMNTAPDLTSKDMTQDMSMEMSQDMPMDMAPQNPCISGATGRYVARFRWEGNGPGSRAYVRYEANTLPDTARWKASANARNVGYMPVYDDTFLGVGGLKFSNTVFMDIELSTLNVPSLSKVTISILGRSFNTTSSGSFNWQTFDGTGNSPYGGVFNSAPYQWYSADATQALPAGKDNILLRLKPDGPSNALIVRGVEVCFAQ